jgi:hypothetical protein
MASIDGGEDGAIAGRVVVSDGPDRLSLFTGELTDPGREWMVPPLAWESPSGTRARFAYEGPLVAFPTHTPFLDLERGLADGEVVEARLDLTFERVADLGVEECFGAVAGVVVVDGRHHAIATRGLATHADTSVRPRFPSCRVTLPIGPWGDLLLVPDGDRPWLWEDGCLSGGLVAAGDVAVRVLGEVRLGATAGTLHLARTHGPGPRRLHASLERLIPVRRPGPRGTVVATTFALVRVAGRSVGWLEAAVLNDPASTP